jgi:2-dehydropantoate 2-reductase
VDAVVLGVKAWQVAEAAEAIRPIVGPETFVVPLQNGVEAPAQLTAVLGRKHVLGGMCRIIAFLDGPGHIRHVGAEPYVAFGELDNRPSERAERLRRAFARAAGVTAEIPENIQAAIWRKFVFVAAGSGMGAITRAPVGIVRSQPETRAMLEEAMREVFEVGQAHNVSLPPQTVRETMAFMDSLPPEASASMQRDMMQGRPSELHAQNGAVVRLGQEVDVATPVHAFIYHSLLPLERKARRELEF